jgi:hypothetical protein
MNFAVHINRADGVGYTGPFLASQRLAVQFNVEEQNGNRGTLTVTPQHSADGGRNWLDKRQLTLTGKGSFSANAVTALYGGDTSSLPHHAMMRLKLSATRSISVSVFVHGRGRARPFSSLVYDGIVPTTPVCSPSFAIHPGAQGVALHALVTPMGANTTPTSTVRLQVSHDGLTWADHGVAAEIDDVRLIVRQENSVGGSADLRNAKGPLGRLLLVSGSRSLDNASHVRVYITIWVAAREPVALPTSLAPQADCKCGQVGSGDLLRVPGGERAFDPRDDVTVAYSSKPPHWPGDQPGKPKAHSWIKCLYSCVAECVAEHNETTAWVASEVEKLKAGNTPQYVIDQFINDNMKPANCKLQWCIYNCKFGCLPIGPGPEPNC